MKDRSRSCPGAEGARRGRLVAWRRVIGLCLWIVLAATARCEEADESAEHGPPFRRLPTTWVFTLEEGEIEFEQFYQGAFFRHQRAIHQLQEEVEFGLPGRFHLGANVKIESDDQRGLRHTGDVFEVRWAFAEWRAESLNPALFAEWHFNRFFNTNDPDECEARLLLSHQFGAKWFWAGNISYGQQIGGDREVELGFSQALIYLLMPGRLSGGIEAEIIRRTDKDTRSRPEVACLIGPSLQVKPFGRFELKLAALAGCTRESAALQLSALVEFEF
jgi:hypothetical protein